MLSMLLYVTALVSWFCLGLTCLSFGVLSTQSLWTYLLRITEPVVVSAIQRVYDIVIGGFIIILQYVCMAPLGLQKAMRHECGKQFWTLIHERVCGRECPLLGGTGADIDIDYHRSS